MMKTSATIELWRFPVTVREESTGQTREDHVVLTKDQVIAAAIDGLSERAFVKQLCEREGLTLLEMGEADKQTVSVDRMWGPEEGA